MRVALTAPGTREGRFNSDNTGFVLFDDNDPSTPNQRSIPLRVSKQSVEIE